MKKLSFVFIILTFIISCFYGCARVNPCTMEELVGTYKLYNYDRINYEENEEGKAEKSSEVDLLNDKNIQMYLVITGEEIGYVAYKDNETELLVREVRIKYNYDTDETDKIRTIEYKSNINSSYEKLQDGWENLGTTNKGKKLNNTHPEYEGFYKTLLYKDFVDFEKVSTDIDLSYILKEFTTLPQTEKLQTA